MFLGELQWCVWSVVDLSAFGGGAFHYRALHLLNVQYRDWLHYIGAYQS